MAVMRLNFFSRELGMATNVTAILPSFDQGFDVGYPLKDIYGPEEKFPVLWLLHGESVNSSHCFSQEQVDFSFAAVV